ncbi:GNAT family N-acetyltransferase [Paenibacillus sp. YAF4_2]|uniref:GNAT family N-acetyltransferase n=1 Tax=Paenibacillus sp. YAF4_2 TaxID=3233085 RepID=UPI003F9AEF38
MENVTIESYEPNRDRTVIRDMLSKDKPFEDMFQVSESVHSDGILVARHNGVTVGFLSFDGFQRATDTTIYVRKEFRRSGIGTKLMRQAEQLLSQQEVVERSLGICMDGDHSSLQFVYKNGYYITHSAYMMERVGELLPESNIVVRQYEDVDYSICQKISQLAFFIMREQTGILPSYYLPPSESERKSFIDNRHNRFVMLVDGEIVAVGVIGGNELRHVSVRPGLQSRGYGRAFVAYLVNEIIRRGEPIVKLGVGKGNFAKKLYESLGFRDKFLNHWVTRYYRLDSRLSRPPYEGMNETDTTNREMK